MREKARSLKIPNTKETRSPKFQALEKSRRRNTGILVPLGYLGISSFEFLNSDITQGGHYIVDHGGQLRVPGFKLLGGVLERLRERSR